MEEKQEWCKSCHGGLLHATLNPNFYTSHSEGKTMVNYQPIRLDFEDLPNDFMIKTIAVVGEVQQLTIRGWQIIPVYLLQ